MGADDRDTTCFSFIRPGHRSMRRPEPPDVAPDGTDVVFGDRVNADVLSDDYPADTLAVHATDDERHRQYNRQLLREFLRSVPRAEAEATLALVRADGTPRLVTRAQLSAAVDRLRPRQRQVVRLALEERWSRQQVCSYLNNISLKTLMRDQIEALDILAER